jgi:uncharacterized protein YxjI
MRYQIKQKFWGFGDNFVIRNEDGDPAYTVHGKVFSWGDKLSIKDMNGETLATISQKLISFKPRYGISKSGRPFAQVVKEFSWFKKKFTLDVPGPNDYKITGDFWDHEYTFQRDGRTVATISKKFWTWRDTYGVDIEPGEDDVAILATAIVIDLICDDEKSASSA